MIKVTPYINTIGTEKFKKLINSPFNFEMLSSVDDSKIYFDGWKEKNMVNWFKYTNDDNIVLEVYAETYIIKIDKLKSYTLIYPKTVNDFINDMDRFNISLYWKNWIDIYFEPKDYLHKDEISNYYINLLKKIDKSHELENFNNE